MARILIVDDEQGYRRQLQIALSGNGHEIRTASSGREGIDVGARFRPEIVITDWMLKDDIHGLHVGRVLRAVYPGMRIILITGFPTDELRNDANNVEVTAFIEKPFTLDHIRSVIDSTAQAEKPHRSASLAVIEIDAESRLLFANDRAKEMFGETLVGRDASRLTDLFQQNPPPDLDAACDRWMVASPDAGRRIFWHFRSEDPLDPNSRLVVLRRGSEPQYQGSALIEMLLGSRDIALESWPFEGRVLIIDHDSLHRSLSVSMLENSGAGCYAVSTLDNALRLLANDEGIQFALLNHEIPNETGQSAVDAIRAVRPDVTIVGMGEPDGEKEPIVEDIEYMLWHPWRLEDLIDILAGRIGKCVECGLRLPLRHPQEDAQAASWVCSNCGARYRAVFDKEVPPDVLRNVRPG